MSLVYPNGCDFVACGRPALCDLHARDRVLVEQSAVGVAAEAEWDVGIVVDFTKSLLEQECPDECPDEIDLGGTI